jgi:hypothetical protein
MQRPDLMRNIQMQLQLPNPATPSPAYGCRTSFRGHGSNVNLSDFCVLEFLPKELPSLRVGCKCWGPVGGRGHMWAFSSSTGLAVVNLSMPRRGQLLAKTQGGFGLRRLGNGIEGYETS